MNVTAEAKFGREDKVWVLAYSMTRPYGREVVGPFFIDDVIESTTGPEEQPKIMYTLDCDWGVFEYDCFATRREAREERDRQNKEEK